MSSDSIALPRVEAASRPLVDALHGWVTTVDHKRLGILYILYALIFLVIGGIEAAIMRIQLMHAHNDFVSPQVFNRMFTMHGTTMIFFVAMPLVFGFANYLIPLMIGARDMAFPRLNAFSFWLMAFGGFLLYFSLVGANGLYGAGNAPDVGWFGCTSFGSSGIRRSMFLPSQHSPSHPRSSPCSPARRSSATRLWWRLRFASDLSARVCGRTTCL